MIYAYVFRNPRVATKVLQTLLRSNICIEKIVKEIMKPEFVNKMARRDYYSLKSPYLVIDYCLELEHPEYNGPRLEKEALSTLLKVYNF